MQEGLGFCVFSCYSTALLNAFQCANTGDVGMGSDGGGREVYVWGGGGSTELAEFLTSRLEHCLALLTAWPGWHIAGAAKCGLANV